MGNICTIEYYPALEIRISCLSFVITWVYLEDIVPNKISQAWNKKVPLGLSYMANLKKKVKYKRKIDNKTVATKGKAKGNKTISIKKYRVTFCAMNKSEDNVSH